MAVAYLSAWLEFYRPALRTRANWLVSLLDLQPTDDVLDVMPRSGYSTHLIASRLRQGRVVSVDPSKLLIDAAYGHLRRHLRTGQASLVRAQPTQLPRFDVAFDKVLIGDARRVADELDEVLALMRKRMTPGGRILVALRPSEPSAAQNEGARLAAALTTAGFVQIETHSSSAEAVTCALGRKTTG